MDKTDALSLSISLCVDIIYFFLCVSVEMGACTLKNVCSFLFLRKRMFVLKQFGGEKLRFKYVGL